MNVSVLGSSIFVTSSVVRKHLVVIVKFFSLEIAPWRICWLLSAQPYLGLPESGWHVDYFLWLWTPFSAAFLASRAFALASALERAGWSHSQPSVFTFSSIFMKGFSLHPDRGKMCSHLWKKKKQNLKSVLRQVSQDTENNWVVLFKTVYKFSNTFNSYIFSHTSSLLYVVTEYFHN